MRMCWIHVRRCTGACIRPKILRPVSCTRFKKMRTTHKSTDNEVSAWGFALFFKKPTQSPEKNAKIHWGNSSIVLVRLIRRDDHTGEFAHACALSTHHAIEARAAMETLVLDSERHLRLDVRLDEDGYCSPSASTADTRRIGPLALLFQKEEHARNPFEVSAPK